jgi:hypothetical protein
MTLVIPTPSSMLHNLNADGPAVCLLQLARLLVATPIHGKAKYLPTGTAFPLAYRRERLFLFQDLKLTPAI